ncbi:F-box/WD-40 repeat-containing protein [Zostera marina]|uniref:F-box/WD-40 repeat-containing protein n=1 Tax=Zostera marina TaxID=29655 RepID=A0A0K9NVZ0_ZOSMR|nr:F-box/WD-40 repeat-containing protein [Zostera marina]
MDFAGGKNRSNLRSQKGCKGRSVYSISTDNFCTIFALLDYFELARCTVVCKLWYDVINKSTLMSDLYHKKYLIKHGSSDKPISSKISMKIFLEKLAIDEHISALTGSSEIHQWSAHNARISQCRMKRGLIATGVGDKMVKLWSAESYKCLDEYSVPDVVSLIDFDFDESKIVGLIGNRLCIWRRNGKIILFKSDIATTLRVLCMRYLDPEAVMGCEDGRARIYDMYSGRCSRIIKVHDGPISCLALDEQLVFSGSTSGRIALTDVSTGERVASLSSSFSPLGITNLCYSPRSHMVFAGSTPGYSHCWDLRTLRPVWETRSSSNIIYSIGHLSADNRTLAVGGIDGVLRILDQNTGEIISRIISTSSSSSSSSLNVQKRKTLLLPMDTRIDSLPKNTRPSISCLAIGTKKMVTVHDDKYVRLWKFGI